MVRVQTTPALERDLIRRKPTSKKFIDRTGDTTQHGLKVLRFEGFSGRYSVWVIECPLCGRHKKVMCNALDTRKSCGCLCEPDASTPLRIALRAIWKRIIQHDCSREWKDKESFVDFMAERMTPELGFYRDDVNKPYGPSNVGFLLHPESWIINEKELFRVGGDVYLTSGVQAILGVSRQRVSWMKIHTPEILARRLKS